jgi:hypothetical protein
MGIETETSEKKSEHEGFVGAIDLFRHRRMSGWGVTRTGDACSVTVIVNGEHRIELPTNMPREDLAAKQQSRGLGGWRVSLRDIIREGENVIEVVFPDGTPLAGSPIVHVHSEQGEAAPSEPVGPKKYLGAIDTPGETMLSGWSVDNGGAGAAVTVQVNDNPPVEVAAEGKRGDLQRSGLSAGLGGWSIDISEALVPGNNRVSVSFPDGKPVPGSPYDHFFGDRPAEEPALARKGKGRATKVTRLHEPVMPSLADLDELSLDDISLAVASGRVKFDPPPPPPVEAEPEPVAAAEEAVPPPEAPRGFFARLFGRR